MPLYRWLVFIHILTAIVWVGGGLHGLAAIASARREGPVAAAQAFTRLNKVNGPLFTTAGIILIVTAVWMVLENPAWEFEQPWIAIAIGLYVVAAALGPAFYGPQGRAIEGLLAEKGPTDPEVVTRIDRVGLVASLDSVLLVTIVLLMVWKPGA